MPDRTTQHAPAGALRAAADAYDDAAVRRLDLGQTTALVADAVWRLGVAEGRRQAAQHLLSLTVDHLVIAIEVALADGAPSNNGELLHRVVAVLADALDRVDAEPPTRQATEGWEREWAVDLGSRGGSWPLHPCDSEADARRVAAAYAKARTVVSRLVGLWEPAEQPCGRAGLHNCGGDWRNHDRPAEQAHVEVENASLLTLDDVAAVGVNLRHRTPEDRRAYLAEQRARHVAHGAPPAWLACFDALAAEQDGADRGQG